MFVFGYNSSYQMILSFPYLVVILTTLGTPKNIFCINNNIMNDNSKQNKTTRARTSLVVLYLRNYAAGIHGHYHESSDHFECPKKSILKSSHPKKYLPNLHAQKNPGIENFKPKKILRSSPSLEVRSTPLGPQEANFCKFLASFSRVFDVCNLYGATRDVILSRLFNL